MSKQLSTVLSTTLALLEQFQGTLIASSAPNAAESSNDAKALPLLATSSSALKAQVTKLSLLAITTPFTHSAVSNVLRACNDSVLPSLVTAALLVTPAGYTKAFHSEVLMLARTALTEFSTLTQEVKNVHEKKEQAKKDGPNKKEDELVKAEKDAVTLATGRVWDACDAVADVANKGVVGFVMRRVEEWRDLVRDAVEEIEDWDPEEEEDDFFDDIMGDEKDADDDHKEDDSEENDSEIAAALKEQKKATLRFLKPVAQIYPTIISYRLKNTGEVPLSSVSGVARLESLMSNLQNIPEQVDEAAGALYEDNVSKSAKFLKKTQKSATQAVHSVALLWDTADGEQKPEDKFTIWSKTWLKVMDEVSKSINAEPNE
ncbi:uncharacterized protein N7459_006069 [Penicillium hispanicum]|uniref:uncharacterized protein n=1 Tax=Penicillium hispanicum TaxID=1080232 RepID=UPI00254115A1|nr:uncharacterized protein N7459_006069 [Penicillium hispanicum]KAJ5580084.1 hypothetical protein N7459_006069 [Penicillium hispanicum]